MKIKYLIKLIYSLIITGFITYLFFKTASGKVVILPFIFCGIGIIGKNTVLILNNKKYIKIFNLIYIISFLSFWFGLTLYWCYVNFINKNYISLLFSLPFWIVGIYVIKKYIINSTYKNK